MTLKKSTAFVNSFRRCFFFVIRTGSGKCLRKRCLRCRDSFTLPASVSYGGMRACERTIKGLRNSILLEKAVSLSNLSIGKVTSRRIEKGTSVTIFSVVTHNFLHEELVTLLCNTLHTTLSTGHTGLTVM